MTVWVSVRKVVGSPVESSAGHVVRAIYYMKPVFGFLGSDEYLWLSVVDLI